MSTNKIASSVEALAEILKARRADGSQVVMCHGVFDPIHPGHILHLQSARAMGDILVVSLTADKFVNKGPWRPIFDERLRALTLAAIGVVDHVIVNNAPTAITMIEKLRPDIYVKGADYEDASDDLTGQIGAEAETVQKVGGKIQFTHEEAFSASTLVNRSFAPYPEEAQVYLNTLRESYTAEDVIGYLKGLKSVKPIVVGEAIIDEYCYVDPLAKAPRESIIAAQYRSEEAFAGGAVSTANHIAGFCDEVTLVAMVGPDPAELEVIISRLASNVRFVPIIAEDRQTVRKRRFVEESHLTKLFEIQFLKIGDISSESESLAADVLTSEIAKHDLVILNDFGHGFMTSRLRNLVIDSAPFLALNTQTNSANLGFNLVTGYSHADYCCIDLAEARLAAGDQRGEPADCGAKLLTSTTATSFMITTGRRGATYLGRSGAVIETPALSPQVIDRVGAGDAFFAITSPWVSQGLPDDLTGFVGNCVGALQVAIVGNRTPVGDVSLYKFITSLLK